MSKVDDELTRRLHGAERPLDVDSVFESLERRRSHRERVRRVQAAVLAFVVLAATVGGFRSLSRVFRDRQATGGTSDGRIVFGRVQLELDPTGGSSSTVSGIWSMAADGTDLRPVVTDRASATTPVWSPDGSRIAFLDKDTHAQGLGTLRLLSSEADGSDVTVIAEGLAEPLVRALAWSPDGTRIAVLDTKGHDLDSLDEFGLPRAEIAVYALNGSREALVDTPGTASGFAWSPDGQGFTVATIPATSDSPLTGVDLVQVDLQGKVLGLLAENVAPYPPAWSPDGSRIAFVRHGPSISGSDGGVDDVWTVDADGSDEERLTEDGGRKPSLAWTPDGARILYSSQTPDGCSIVAVRRDGSGRTVVADRSMMGGCAQEISVQLEVTSTPPSPSSDPSPAATSDGRDIGLGFDLCNLDRLGGIDFLGDGADGAAWTGTKVRADGSCPKNYDDRYGVAVDYTGDGVADSWSGETIDYCGDCDPWKAMDLNGDGRKELLVILDYFSIMHYGVYTLLDVNGRPEIEPFRIGEPGNPEHELDPGKPFTFWVGGDAGLSDWFYCETLPEFWLTGVVSTIEPPPGAVKTVNRTHVSLMTDGIAHILFADTYTVPAETDLQLPYTTPDHSDPDCGIGVRPG